MAEELRGWKDIGAHFGTSDRTAQRWERDHGMPVHRTGRTRGASVYAFVDELDAWRRSPAGESARSENGNGSPPTPATAGVLPGRGRSRALLAVVVVALLVATIVVAWTIRSRQALPARVQITPEPYAVPKSSKVFLLKITHANGEPFTFHVLDGDFATLTANDGAKFGFLPALDGSTAALTVCRLDGGHIRELRRTSLPARSPVHITQSGLAVDVEWLDTLTTSDLPPAPPGKRRSCCITGVAPDGSSTTACAAQVSTPSYGSCCGFEGCSNTK